MVDQVTNEQIADLGRDLQAARKAHRAAIEQLSDAHRAVRARELDVWAAERLAIRLHTRFLALVDRTAA
ncbi:hypothetical protein MMSR116_29110 [Methylobacterium mesophilicum SR1.6/6]|uniref:Uncharacterized protein n=1 Tax=Methylobacterium mesophilicum SR1.6/6 TaxID=908290 RepID=A0A6B9FUE6_9HYPH|nr:hypothetical protein [Methylobacterium mesophilicum]QGY05499.1 hypothetical protein MMSR116_29110 [Methylobacterium mesophilicum SR1.6/6]